MAKNHTYINERPIIALTPWGEEYVECPVTKALLTSAAVERIKGVDQSGACAYFGYTPFFRRYDHCVGVWSLVRRAGGSQQEQWAALLHDVSHTVFSHVADYLFSIDEHKHSYQDTIHIWALEQMGVREVLKQTTTTTLEELHPDQESYKRLEQPLPDLCADRIEYVIHTGLLWNKLTQQEVCDIHAALQFDQEKNHWYFTSLPLAQKFSTLTLYFNEYLWGAPWNCLLNICFAEILKKALEIGVVTHDMIHFGTDEDVLHHLMNCSNNYIQSRLNICRSIHTSYKVVAGDNYDACYTPKFRGVNPWVQTPNGMQRLYDLDSQYAHDFDTLKQRFASGIKIIMLQPLIQDCQTTTSL